MTRTDVITMITNITAVIQPLAYNLEMSPEERLYYKGLSHGLNLCYNAFNSIPEEDAK